jgi:hypothetical protein
MSAARSDSRFITPPTEMARTVYEKLGPGGSGCAALSNASTKTTFESFLCSRQVTTGAAAEVGRHYGVMEWSAPPLTQWPGIGNLRGAAMTTAPMIIGIDLGKNWFHLVGLDEGGATILRKKLNRAQLAEYARRRPGASSRRNPARVPSTGAGCSAQQGTKCGSCPRSS